MEELLYEFVDLIPDTYACPYMARIVGEDPVFRFHRAFLRYEERTQWFLWREYLYLLPREGVYEWCVRRFDQRTGKLLRREREWFAFFDGEVYAIPYSEVLYTAWNIDAQLGAA